MTISEILNEIFKALGGNPDALKDNETISDSLEDLKSVLGANGRVVVLPAPADTDFWGTTASQIQSNVQSIGANILGDLKYLASGQLVTDWGAGNFLGLKFIITDPSLTYADVKVGLDPSVSSGLVTLDSDLLAVVKVTDKDTQRFCVEIKGERTFYSLAGLNVATE